MVLEHKWYEYQIVTNAFQIHARRVTCVCVFDNRDEITNAFQIHARILLSYCRVLR